MTWPGEKFFGRFFELSTTDNVDNRVQRFGQSQCRVDADFPQMIRKEGGAIGSKSGVEPTKIENRPRNCTE